MHIGANAVLVRDLLDEAAQALCSMQSVCAGLRLRWGDPCLGMTLACDIEQEVCTLKSTALDYMLCVHEQFVAGMDHAKQIHLRGPVRAISTFQPVRNRRWIYVCMRRDARGVADEAVGRAAQLLPG